MSKIIDITGKKPINCPECGFTIEIPPRKISMEKPRHMKDVARALRMVFRNPKNLTGIDGKIPKGNYFFAAWIADAHLTGRCYLVEGACLANWFVY